jgi:metal-dependent amidase/aminoacylase/carboxypeptidase family protein
VLDDVDANMIVHSTTNRDGKTNVEVGGSSNGFVGKFIKYTGKEAHAGGAPHDGINALNAAILGLMGIHLQRETLKDDDTIRIHPIMTKGGNLVNVIPSDVRLETYVRGKTMPAVIDAAKKVDRALTAGADAIGATVDIETLPGYLPNTNEKTMAKLFEENIVTMVGQEAIHISGHGTGSTDEGDISCLMPSLHPSVGGIEGVFHTENFVMVDPYVAYIVGAKAMAMTAIDMLYDGAKVALEIKKNYKPSYDKESYLKMWESVLSK